MLCTGNTESLNIPLVAIYQNKDPEKVKQVIDTVTRSGGIDYAQKKMEGFRDDALKILDTFDNVELKQGLEELVRFTTDRKF